MRFKLILTGATGLVGEGVLLECLEHPAVMQVLSVSRKSCGRQHPKLTECLVPDFMELDAVANQLSGYDACFYCAGISSRGMTEAAYSHVTYDVPLHFAETLLRLNPQMIFCHMSGGHADSSEKGRVMWARVKGRAENAMMRLGFRRVYNFRPGFMKPTDGQRNVPPFYRAISRLYPVLRVLLPSQVLTMQQVGLAMIESVLKGYPKQVLEIKDMQALAGS
ncbi:epimerase [Granulicella sp. WH15]|uniref:NAD-dependent epimerase/dehydratase family protein n=1 Tax=Granulicella sp. WH15 TaxID=2602070 RepID=UPI001367385C|nr:NAD-dependent epimerase/dehydratase family protein [Granulicella sp. WH15]QHN04254.1 epimerase [Granulicella sp. WH15]